jgi:hypothetical protein
MRSYSAPAIAIAMIMPAILSARSDDIPTLDVRPVCRGIAMQGELEEGLQQTSFEQCVKSEEETREQIKKEWSTFSTADKSHCIALANTGGESSYTELITCMEMARDVRALRSAEAASSGTATTRTRFSPPTRTMQPTPLPPTPTPAPAPANTAPRPSSSNEPPKMTPAPADTASRSPSANASQSVGVDTTLLKQLQQAKTDALGAKTSEQAARLKLAEAQADLKQAKNDAGRATKEAEQAKAGAQTAREAQAKAESKLVDAERARVAAEEQEKACQSAAKSQSGLGARLRSWFGRKPSNP